jgi:hypothetical protein
VPGKLVYEERVVVLLATNREEAIAKAEAEADRYAARWADAKYLGYVVVYDMTEPGIQDGTEVFSLMRQTDLSSQAFLDRYHDTESERATTL